MKRTAAVVAAALFLAVTPLGIWAQSSNDNSFTIAPPPLSYPDYAEPGTMQHKVTGTYVHVSVDHFNLTGLGGAYDGRWVRDHTADGLGQGLSVALGAYILSGSGSGLDVNGTVESAEFNYERELMNKDGRNAIFFAGPAISLAYIYGSADAYDLEASTFLVGGQIGAQMTFTSSDLKISPWVMYQALTGSTSVTISGATSQTTDTDVSVSTTAFGFDVLHVPSGFTLSGLLQNGGGDSSSKVTIISFSYGWGSGKPAEGKTAHRTVLQEPGSALAAR